MNDIIDTLHGSPWREPSDLEFWDGSRLRLEGVDEREGGRRFKLLLDGGPDFTFSLGSADSEIAPGDCLGFTRQGRQIYKGRSAKRWIYTWLRLHAPE